MEDVAIGGVVRSNLYIGWNIILGPKDSYGNRVFQHMSKSSHFLPRKEKKKQKEEQRNPKKEDAQRKAMATYRQQGALQ